MMPPASRTGADQTANEETGPHSVIGWATSHQARAANENGPDARLPRQQRQQALFADAARHSTRAGNLTYTLAPNACGTANVTVQLHDNGGTANGGVDVSAAQTFTITVTPSTSRRVSPPGGNQTRTRKTAGRQTASGWATNISPGPATATWARR